MPENRGHFDAGFDCDPPVGDVTIVYGIGLGRDRAHGVAELFLELGVAGVIRGVFIDSARDDFGGPTRLTARINRTA